MIQIYNNKHLTWDGTTSINHYELFADTVTDLPSDPYYFSSPDKGSYKMAQGSIAWVIDVSEIYMLDSGGTWVLESISGGGGGGGGTTNYNALTNKPSINSVELSGNKTLSDLGIQSAIDSSHKLSADLVTNGTTNKFNMQADWTQADNTSGDFIKNKPTLGTAAATDATAYATAAQGTKADSAIQSAGTGLSKSGTTLNHSNSVTAKTTQGFAQIAYDAQGHITGSTAATTAQADAINSGITLTDVAQITTNKNNILLKADKISFGFSGNPNPAVYVKNWDFIPDGTYLLTYICSSDASTRKGVSVYMFTKYTTNHLVLFTPVVEVSGAVITSCVATGAAGAETITFTMGQHGYHTAAAIQIQAF